jgi:hypothetical protein
MEQGEKLRVLELFDKTLEIYPNYTLAWNDKVFCITQGI